MRHSSLYDSDRYYREQSQVKVAVLAESVQHQSPWQLSWQDAVLAVGAIAIATAAFWTIA